MKKLLIIMLFGVMVLGLAGCDFKNNEDKDNQYVQIGNESDIVVPDKKVIFKMKEGTASSATFILENNSDLTVGYGESYFLQKEENGKWYELKTISDRVFILPLYHLESNESKELAINLEYGYGKLTSGKYRVVKDVLFLYDNDKSEDFFVAGEFNIE